MAIVGYVKDLERNGRNTPLILFSYGGGDPKVFYTKDHWKMDGTLHIAHGLMGEYLDPLISLQGTNVF